MWSKGKRRENMYKFGTIIEFVEGAVAALEEVVDLSAHCCPRQEPGTGTGTCSVRAGRAGSALGLGDKRDWIDIFFIGRQDQRFIHLIVGIRLGVVLSGCSGSEHL